MDKIFNLRDYGFEPVEKYVSKVEQAGFSYPVQHADPRPFTFEETFRNEGIEVLVPLGQAIFEANGQCKDESELSQGGNLMLANNMELTAPVMLAPGKILNLNLNDKTMTAPLFAENNGEVAEGNSDSYAFWVKEDSMLTIEGEGDVKAQPATYSMAVWANGGNVTIKGGKFYNDGEGSDLIYASNGGKVYIYGGEFHPCKKQEGVDGTKDAYTALNIKDKDRGISEIKVYGGKFYNFNPANNLSEGPNTNFVAEGYKAVEVEPNVWEVMPE